MTSIAKSSATKTIKTKTKTNKPAQRRVTVEKNLFNNGVWAVHSGKLEPKTKKLGRKSAEDNTSNVFRIVGEKLPFDALPDVKKHLETGDKKSISGVYIAYDSMGCPRYIGRGSIFNRLSARKRAQSQELLYFSFYVIDNKKHEREIETLLIHATSFLLEFNERKRRVGIINSSIRDYEPGTQFYLRLPGKQNGR